jgi:hypothetical protein
VKGVDFETASEASTSSEPMPDLRLYEQMIKEGIADADQRHGAVDHLTARRLAIWLGAQAHQRDFAEALDRFTRTGAVSRELRAHVRTRARSVNYPHRDQAFRLLQYIASRGPDLGPLGPEFARSCDQIDQADAILAELRERVRQRPEKAGQAKRGGGPEIVARATQNARTVSFTLDVATANLAMHAIAADAGEREAHAREVDRYSQDLPEGSYGRQNREVIVAREMRAAQRLRAIERAYREAIEHDTGMCHDPAPEPRLANREIEME